MQARCWTSIPRVLDVEIVRGARARGEPDLLLEVPHGATRAAHFRDLRAELAGEYPDDLADFFFVNTDVGAPELARRVAQRCVAADPRRTAAVVRCLIPRTFVDCNRVIDAAAAPATSGPGEVTPGLHAWVKTATDRALLLGRYAAYRARVEELFYRVVERGLALMVHTYAPRSVDVAVDADIVKSLRAAYAPGQVDRWPLRASVDLICDAPDGTRLCSPELLAQARSAFTAAGFDVVLNGAYSLHESTLAHLFARRHPGRTLCLEVRRDLLVPEFTPFAEMLPDPARVDRAAAPLSEAILAVQTAAAPRC